MLSVILATKDASDQPTRTTIQSIYSQDCPLELVIVSGGAEQPVLFNDDKITNVFVGGVNTGIYSAFNVGVQSATKKYVMFINAGDVFVEQNYLDRCLTYAQDSAILVSNCVHFSVTASVSIRRIHFAYPLHLMFHVNSAPPHPGALIPRKFFSDAFVGLYDTRRQVAADAHWFIEAYKSNLKFISLPFNGVALQTGGVSTQALSFVRISRDLDELMLEKLTKMLPRVLIKIFREKIFLRASVNVTNVRENIKKMLN